MKPVVVQSLNDEDTLRCVDILRYANGTFGWAEFRRDPEDPHGWRPAGASEHKPCSTQVAALAAAITATPWLATAPNTGSRN